MKDTQKSARATTGRDTTSEGSLIDAARGASRTMSYLGTQYRQARGPRATETFTATTPSVAGSSHAIELGRQDKAQPHRQLPKETIPLIGATTGAVIGAGGFRAA